MPRPAPRDGSPQPAGSAAADRILDAALDAFFDRLDAAARVAVRRGTAPSRGPGVVAFSGGADSTALLAALARRGRRGGPAVVAAHLDHAADPGSAQRARLAAVLARRLGVPFVSHRLAEGELTDAAAAAGGWEAAARRRRYRFLAAVAAAAGAAWVATAHHRDDQAETVLLRLLAGSGVEGLAAIAPWRPLRAGRRGRAVGGSRPLLVRPLLDLPRATLVAAVAAEGLTAVVDPTNRDPRRRRNLLRHHLMPRLEAEATAAGEVAVAPRLAHLAGAARGARHRLAGWLQANLPQTPIRAAVGLAVDRRRLRALPAALLPHALAYLHRRAGAPYPASRRARRELLRQVAGDGDVGCDCGAGWRWEGDGDELRLLRRRGASPMTRFSYILEVPGEVEIPELHLALRLHPAPPAEWMYRGEAHRAGLALPLAAGDSVTVRNRRPGDRLHPLGAAGSRRLKDVLIDRRVARHRRDRLPLLCLGESIAWVPGVTVDEAYRLPEPPGAGTTVWVVELVAAQPATPQREDLQTQDNRATSSRATDPAHTCGPKSAGATSR